MRPVEQHGEGFAAPLVATDEMLVAITAQDIEDITRGLDARAQLVARDILLRRRSNSRLVSDDHVELKRVSRLESDFRSLAVEQ